MNCDTFLDRASEYVDGTLDEATRAAAEAHLDECDACRDLAADLRKVQRAAGELERVAPPANAWARVLDRLQADAAFSMTSATSAKPQPLVGSGYQSLAWLAMAAALVLAIATALVYVVKQPSALSTGTGVSRTVPAGVANSDDTDPVKAVEKELQMAATHYEKAIASLEQVAKESDSPLDPDVMATLRKNLQVIDTAINESQTALQAQPESQFAQESLFDAFRRKISLLQDTIALMNEMRKGNPEGAARVVEGLNKS